MTEVVCSECGKSVHAGCYVEAPVYCSRECRSEAAWRRLRDNPLRTFDIGPTKDSDYDWPMDRVVPLVRGGQGRSDESVRRDGGLLWGMLLGLALWGAILLVWWLVGGGS